MSFIRRLMEIKEEQLKFEDEALKFMNNTHKKLDKILELMKENGNKKRSKH